MTEYIPRKVINSRNDMEKEFTLTANYFAVNHPYHINDLHSYLFVQLFSKNKVNCFQKKKVIYFTNGDYIFIRTQVSDEYISMAVETAKICLSKKIVAKVMVALNRSVALNIAEIEEYRNKNNCLPTGKHGKRRMNLSVDEAKMFTTKALENAGVQNIDYLSNTSGPRLKICGFDVDTVDLEFSCDLVDPELFKEAWLNGIGRDKIYGFGMIRIDGTAHNQSRTI